VFPADSLEECRVFLTQRSIPQIPTQKVYIETEQLNEKVKLLKKKEGQGKKKIRTIKE